MSNIILGSFAAFEQPISYSWSQVGGVKITRSWKTASEATKQSLESQLQAVGWEYAVKGTEAGNWEVTATGGSDPFSGPQGSQITEYWELSPKDTAKDILGSHHSLVAGLTQANIDQIRNEVDDKTKTAANTSLSGNSLIIFKLMRAGVEHTEIEQPILSHNWQVPVGVNLTYSYSNIGRIYSNATLFGEGVPSDFQTSIAAWTASFVDPTYGTNRISLVFGWKKKAPSQRISADGKREVSQQWEFGLWSTDMYLARL